ncbi:amidase family protein, partial [Dolosigranulum pigrum]
MNLFTEDATYYANLIKQDKVTSVELVKRALANIESLNPMLNAVTHVQKEYALKRAQVLDENKDKLHTLPPFYGVPTLLKDVGQQQAGFPATSGSQLLHQNIAETTDYVVERI